MKLIRMQRPRLIVFGDIALNSEKLDYIDRVKFLEPQKTAIFLKIPRFFAAYEEKTIIVKSRFQTVVEKINKYQ